MLDVKRLRRDFPILSSRVHGQPLIYLDNAATTQKPRVVIDAISRYYRQSNANVHRASHALSAAATQAFETARDSVARFLKVADSAEVIWTRGATESLNLIAQSYGRSQLKAGDRILLSELEHHANIVPWQLLAQQTGAQIDVVPVQADGSLNMDVYRQLLANKPKVVSICHVSNALGTLNPVAEISRLAKAAGAVVVIDGAQAAPHLELDIPAIGCDFYLFSGHKVFGPTGIGALWGRRELLEAMPPWQAGGEMIGTVSFTETRFNKLPFKFEAGTPNIAGAIGLGAALDWLMAQERPALLAHEQALLEYAHQELKKVPGLSFVGTAAEKASVISFTLAGSHQQDAGLLLDQQGIAIRAGHHCTMPLMQALGLPGTLRASFAFYNTFAEVDALVKSLTELQTEPQSVEHATAETAELNAYQRLKDAQGKQARYRELMLLGKGLPALPAELKTEEQRLHGCESSVWLVSELDENGLLHFRADSDARVIRGLIALLLELSNRKTPQALLKLDFNAIFAELSLEQQLSPSRANGLKAILDAMRTFATQHAR